MLQPLPLSLTQHAVERWHSRVDPDGSVSEARLALGRFLLLGRRRPNPRRWTIARAEPGTSFVYWSGRPGVCAVVVGRTVVTVLTRSLCRGGLRPRRHLALVEPARRPEQATWRWSGIGEEAA